MQRLNYTASDRRGILHYGQLQAESQAQAKEQLQARGLVVLELDLVSSSHHPQERNLDLLGPRQSHPIASVPPFTNRPQSSQPDDKTVAVPLQKKKYSFTLQALKRDTWSSAERARYLHQLAALFAAGIPLHRATLIAGRDHSFAFKTSKKLCQLPLDLQRGQAFSKAIELSGLFSPFMVQAIRIAEDCGRLHTTLSALAKAEEEQLALKRALLQRISYPLLVLSTMTLGLLILAHVMSQAMVVLPNQSSPLGVNALHRLLQSAAFLPASATLCTLFIASSMSAWRNPTLRIKMEQALWTLPVLGPLVRRIESVTVTSHLLLALQAGLSLERALTLGSQLMRTQSFRHALLGAAADLIDGCELTPSLARSHLLPSDILALISAGEYSGCLEKTLSIAAKYSRDSAQHTLEVALAVLEPLLLALLGLLLGGLLLTTFLPIFQGMQDL